MYHRHRGLIDKGVRNKDETIADWLMSLSKMINYYLKEEGILIF